MTTPPIIDDRVEHVTTTFLRSLNAKTLRELTGPVVIHRGESGRAVADTTGGAGEPLAVIIPYALYLEMQQAFWPASFFDLLEKIVFLSEDGKLLELMTRIEGWTQHEPADPSATQHLADLNACFGPPNVTGPSPTELQSDMRWCDHCRKPFPARTNAKGICTDCFVLGHRSGNCMKCAESKEVL